MRATFKILTLAKESIMTPRSPSILWVLLSVVPVQYGDEMEICDVLKHQLSLSHSVMKDLLV